MNAITSIGVRPCDWHGWVKSVARSVRLIVALSAVVTLIVGCSDYPVMYKYRLTLEVEADGKVHSGSSIVGVWVRDQPAGFLAPGGKSRHAIGEATVVDLGGGRLLVALLTQRDWKSSIWMPDAEKVPEARDLEPSELPLLVTFGNPNDPATIRQVQPSDLGASFGKGVRWRRLHVETTDEPPTSKILKQLPWLESRKTGMLDGRKFPTIEAENRLANDLAYWHFKSSGY